MDLVSRSGLRLLQTLDDHQVAAGCRQDLDISRPAATELGRTAVSAIKAGQFETASGESVDWPEAVQLATESKRSIPPDAALPDSRAGGDFTIEVQVINETTLRAARRLTDQGARPLALNFANGVEPGGGFLHGSRAQEEVLCRSSALYATLVNDPMYVAHRARTLPDSTDWAILSQNVPVFRLDDGTALSAPWVLDFVTCAAPYAPTVGSRSFRRPVEEEDPPRPGDC